MKLIDLDHRIWSSTTTPAKIEWKSVDEYQQRNPEGSQVVALVDNKIVGYLGYHAPTPLETNRHVMEIDIAVHSNFHGLGIGRKLLEKGIKKLSLRVLATNTGAIAFYRKCGFKEQGRLVNEFYIDGKYVDDLLMFRLIE